MSLTLPATDGSTLVFINSAACPALRKVTAKNDADIFESPTEPRRIIGRVVAGTEGLLLDYRDGWCNVSLFGGAGWLPAQDVVGCPAPPNFYLAAKISPCDDDFCPEDATYGFMEAVEAANASMSNALDFNRFKTGRTAAMAAVRPDHDGIATYQSAAGDVIKFQISEDRPVILAVSDVSLPAFGLPAPVIDTYYLTRGGVVNAGAGKAIIRSPWGNQRIDIDFTDWRNPRISDSPIPAGATTEIYAVATDDPDGALKFHKHLDADNPALTVTEGMAGPVRLGKSWDRYQTLIAAIGSPVIYAMEPAGCFARPKGNPLPWCSITPALSFNTASSRTR